MVTMAMARTDGKVELLGMDFDRPEAYKLLTQGQIGIVYQDDVIWSELSVDENLKIMGRLKGLTEDEIVLRSE